MAKGVDTSRSEVVGWLLEGDPAIRWQALADLAGAGSSAVKRERARTETDGWGARLLALQDREGTWGHGLYTPKWTSTFYTLLLLRDFGLNPANTQAKRACEIILSEGHRSDGGLNFGPAPRAETCISGMGLSLAAYFDEGAAQTDELVHHLLEQQMNDGGWNCRRPRGATHSSVNTTISVLEGLRTFEAKSSRKRRDVRVAQERAREFLLEHRLFRSHRTGRVMKSEFTRFVFPPRWHYDVLRALDYFRAVDAPFDARLEEAIDMVQRKRDASGRWRLEYCYRGEAHFQLEKVGLPSRWNTLRALRVLDWWARIAPSVTARSATVGFVPPRRRSSTG